MNEAGKIAAAVGLTLVGVALVVRAFPSSENAAGFVVADNSAGVNQARLKANKLEQAMRRWVVDFDRVRDVFEATKNDKQFEELVNQFGQRRYDRFVWGLPDWFYDLGNITDWLMWSLSDSRIEQLNTILADNGVTYRI